VLAERLIIIVYLAGRVSTNADNAASSRYFRILDINSDQSSGYLHPNDHSDYQGSGDNLYPDDITGNQSDGCLRPEECK
jgi:hypothetical protein